MMKHQFNWKQLFVLTLTIALASFLFFPSQGEASIRKTEEADGQILYQSRHQLQDSQQQSWQLVLFKKDSGTANLRLVGFPGKVEIAHPEPLIIETDRAAWQAKDLFAEKSPAPNVGQYDVGAIIPELSQQESLILKVPETNGETVTLKVPGVMVLEWKIVVGNE